MIGVIEITGNTLSISINQVDILIFFSIILVLFVFNFTLSTIYNDFTSHCIETNKFKWFMLFGFFFVLFPKTLKDANKYIWNARVASINRVKIITQEMRHNSMLELKYKESFFIRRLMFKFFLYEGAI